MLNKKKIIALVPARGGSKGIKNKNLKVINKKTLVEIVSEFIDKSKYFDSKVLSSDSKKILDIGKKLKFVNIKRPKNLAGDNIGDIKIINHILSNKKFLKFDYLVYLQPTSPIRKINHLKKALKKVIIKKSNGSWSVSKIDKKNHPNKILVNKKGFLKLFNKDGNKFISRQKLEDIYIRNGIFYIFSIKSLIKHRTIYLPKMYLSFTKYKHVNIDNIKDFKKAESILTK